MPTKSVRYLAYMLRLWQVRGENKSCWRASLENPHTGERKSFVNLQALWAYLKKETEARNGNTKLLNGDESSTKR